MELILLVVGAIAAVVFYFIWGSRKMVRMNADPVQQRLATLLSQAGQTGDPDNAIASQIIELVVDAGWSSGETGTRIAHALSMVKIGAPPPVYERAVHIGQGIAMNYR